MPELSMVTRPLASHSSAKTFSDAAAHIPPFMKG